MLKIEFRSTSYYDHVILNYCDWLYDLIIPGLYPPVDGGGHQRRAWGTPRTRDGGKTGIWTHLDITQLTPYVDWAIY